jgi:hypothetical protein
MIAGLLGRVAHVLTAIVLRRLFLARDQLNDVGNGSFGEHFAHEPFAFLIVECGGEQFPILH